MINPAGIIFGENARLDIGGSFYSSTASSILFEDGEFSAVDNLAQPILTINAPIGLSFRDEPGDIINRASTENGLGINSGETLALLGGNVTLEAGQITAPGGNIELGGLSTAGEIRIDAENNFTFAEGVETANVTLSARSTVNVRGSDGGRIEINANNLELAGASQLLAGIEQGASSPQAQADDISINTNGFIARGESGVRNENLGTGNAGNINITTGTLDFREGSAIVASTFGTGNAGNININASGDVSFDRDFGGVFSTIGVREDEGEANVPDVVGEGGDLTINANSLFLANGAQLSTKTAGVGNAGNVLINANDTVVLDGKGTILVQDAFNIATAILTQVEAGSDDGTKIAGQGNAGNVEINTDKLVLTTAEEQFFGPFILADNRGGVGDAGDLTINASDSVSLSGRSSFNTQIGENAVGNAGDIKIDTDSLSMTDISFIVAQTQGRGNPGNITINAEGEVLLEGVNSQNASKINAQINEGGIAERGSEIKITADSLVLDERALIVTGIQAGGSGNGGNITIDVGSLSLDNRSELTSLISGTGNAGNITVNAEEQISLEGTSKFLSQILENDDSTVVPTGDAGNIVITTPKLFLDDAAQISF